MLCSGHRVGGDCEDAQPAKPWTHNPECLHWRARELVDDLRERIASLEAELREVRASRDLGTHMERAAGEEWDKMRERAEQAERERDALHSLKCDIGKALGGEDPRPFVERIREMAKTIRELRELCREALPRLTHAGNCTGAGIACTCGVESVGAKLRAAGEASE